MPLASDMIIASNINMIRILKISVADINCPGSLCSELPSIRFLAHWFLREHKPGE